MKVTVNIDCTPEEARTFLGMPDVKPMQEALLREMEEQIRASMKAMSPESVMKIWFPAAAQNAEHLQKSFFSYFQQIMSANMPRQE